MGPLSSHFTSPWVTTHLAYRLFFFLCSQMSLFLSAHLFLLGVPLEAPILLPRQVLAAQR